MAHAVGRLRTPAAILDTAAHVLAERPDASINDIAAAAGVGRATLYRYFPTREALLQALAAEAVDEAVARIAEAGLEQVAVPEALQRFLRAILAVGDRYAILIGDRVTECRPQFEEAGRTIAVPLQAVFQRGIDDGTLRNDLDLEVLFTLFRGMVAGAFEAQLARTLGVEQAAAAIASAFLDGARNRS
jgi:AcrR family transcriptional regulator